MDSQLLCHPFSDLYTKLIETYTNNRALWQGRLLHAHLIINGLSRKSHFACKLILFYFNCKEFHIARKVFDEMPSSNARRWIVLAGAYARVGHHQEVMNIVSEMQKEGVKMDKYVVPSVLKACGHMGDIRTGEMLHGVGLKYEFSGDAFVTSALIDMYSRCGELRKAKRVFGGMVVKDVVALNALVAGCVQEGGVDEAMNLVEEMKVKGVQPNLTTWNTLIAGFSQAENESAVDGILSTMHDNGDQPDVVSWTSVISGHVQNFRNKEAFKVFKKMLDLRLCPSTFTISCLLPACANVGDLSRGKEIHGYAVVKGIDSEVFVRSALIDMYAKCGLICQAEALFSQMSDRNTPTWNSMIFGYANHGYGKEAIELFHQMLKEAEGNLDHLTFTAALTACSHGGMVQLGHDIFNMMPRYRIQLRQEHYACMVDLLGRAGKLAEAYDMIQTMQIKPDQFVWGALIGACKQHGNVDLAEIAAKELAKLEPVSAGSSLLMSNLYADCSRWGNVAKVRKLMKKKKLKKLPGSSWIEVP
ncbi:hypothetical protein LIER_12015 [Lithospermum erythrorhizon]|uniref:Pentatricopeptide repeat-containing protein n=1 Tax=Lithospermum erythrorhizon TaxID=34254 RepID=A0AAV3PQ78_LITER